MRPSVTSISVHLHFGNTTAGVSALEPLEVVPKQVESPLL